MSEQAVKIREFRAADLETLHRIDLACFSGDIAFSRAELEFCLNHPQSIARVAEGVGRILGFVLARIESPFYAHILTLDIVPEARRCRIGTSLMEELHGRFRNWGIGAAILEVAVNNVPARRLYEKMNYRYFGTLYGYYHGREDAFRMARLFHKREKASEEG